MVLWQDDEEEVRGYDNAKHADQEEGAETTPSWSLTDSTQQSRVYCKVAWSSFCIPSASVTNLS